MATTYSFPDLTGSLSHPVIGSFIFGGDPLGLGEAHVVKSTERTILDTAADGGIMISKISGNSGVITFHVQQTSILHKWLLNSFNLAWSLPSSQWGLWACLLRNVSDGTSHLGHGGAFLKEADVPYQAQGQRLIWTMPYADVVNITA
jgi:hypothetical protein